MLYTWFMGAPYESMRFSRNFQNKTFEKLSGQGPKIIKTSIQVFQKILGKFNLHIILFKPVKFR